MEPDFKFEIGEGSFWSFMHLPQRNHSLQTAAKAQGNQDDPVPCTWAGIGSGSRGQCFPCSEEASIGLKALSQGEKQRVCC